MSDSTQRLIRDLADDLAPVRPVPRLRVSVGWVWGIGAATALVGVLALGVNDQLPRDLDRNPVLGGVAVGLLALALGSFVGVAAGGVPGREDSARRGWAVAVFGAAVGLVCTFWLGTQALVGSAVSPLLGQALSCLVCIGIAALLALPATAAATLLLARAAPRQGPRLAAAAALGAAALAGIATLAHCPQMDAVHLMLGHALAPLFALLFLLLPALLMLRKLSPGFAAQR